MWSSAIRRFSPLAATTDVTDYSGLTFDKWLGEIKAKAFQCTDATQLFIAAAWKQNLKAREWHLLVSGWPPGDGHSVAEFLNPRTGKWQLVDAQRAAIIRDRKTGAGLDMVELLKHYKAGEQGSVAIDYGPFKDFFTVRHADGDTWVSLFKDRLLSTPVLQLRQATWFAHYPRTFAISGHFVIAYPIVVDGWTHAGQVLWTKLSLILMALSGIGLAASVRRRA